MKKILVALALAALALGIHAMGNKPDELRPAVAAAQNAASGAASSASAAASSQQQIATMTKEAASAAGVSVMNATATAEDRAKAEQAAAEAEKALAATKAAAKQIAATHETGRVDFPWKHPGADPYAASRDKAMGTRPSAFQKLDFPPEVVALLMEATKSPGEEVKLPMGTRLTSMLSKDGVAHRNTVIVWQSPIIGTEFVAPAEKWTVTWNGKAYSVYLFKVCNNWSSVVGPAPTMPAPVASAPPPVTGTCPEVYTLNLRVWQVSVRNLFGIGRVIDAERSIVNGFANRVDLSRNYGGRLRAAEAKGNPDAKLSETPRRWRISLINTDEARGGSSVITAEKFLYDVTVTGITSMRFKKTTLEAWDAIRAVAVDNDVQSPPTFGKTGLHELRFFNKLPGKGLGEWDNNPDPDCLMNEHSVESLQPVLPPQ